MGIKLDATYAYLNNDKENGWHMVGLVSGKSMKEIIGKRRKNGDIAGSDYKFIEQS